MDANGFPPVVPDLTGHVVKTEVYPFAYGGSSDIWKGCWDCDFGVVEVAVKVMKGIQDAIVQNRLIRETRVLATLNHPNISPVYGISFDFYRPNMPCLVSPYYRNGDISRYLKEHPSVDKLPLIAQIADAVSYMHHMSAIHGDIKGPNIFINDKYEANLGDFGQARILHMPGFTTKTSQATWRYWAPEMMGDDDAIQRVTTATDVYAFAMTVVEIFTGRIPFWYIRNDVRVVLIVTNGGRPQHSRCPMITHDIWRVLEACWDADPKRRPSMISVSRFFNSKLNSPAGQLARS